MTNNVSRMWDNIANKEDVIIDAAIMTVIGAIIVACVVLTFMYVHTLAGI